MGRQFAGGISGGTKKRRERVEPGGQKPPRSNMYRKMTAVPWPKHFLRETKGKIGQSHKKTTQRYEGMTRKENNTVGGGWEREIGEGLRGCNARKPAYCSRTVFAGDRQKIRRYRQSKRIVTVGRGKMRTGKKKLRDWCTGSQTRQIRNRAAKWYIKGTKSLAAIVVGK